MKYVFSNKDLLQKYDRSEHQGNCTLPEIYLGMEALHREIEERRKNRERRALERQSLVRQALAALAAEQQE